MQVACPAGKGSSPALLLLPCVGKKRDPGNRVRLSSTCFHCHFLQVVGRPYMPPYWGLGFHLCRWGYGSLNGTMTVNDNMRRYGIPQDVQWNDIEYMESHLDFTINQTVWWEGLGDFVKKLHDNYHQRYIPIVVSCTQEYSYLMFSYSI